VKLIEENLRHSGAPERYAIIRLRFAVRPARDETPQSLPTGSFDLAVLDPPYDEPDLTVSIAAAEPLIAPGGMLVLEHARRRPAPEQVGRLRLSRDLVSGDSALAFYVTGSG